jgi:hypothetical protein
MKEILWDYDCPDLRFYDPEEEYGVYEWDMNHPLFIYSPPS